MLERRVHLMMDEGRYALLESLAGQRGTSIAALVREAVDVAYGKQSVRERRRAAADLILSAEPVDVPDDPSAIDREASSLWGES